MAAQGVVSYQRVSTKGQDFPRQNRARDKWLAQAPLQARIAQARSYTADPVTLPLAAEQRLKDLMEKE